MLISTYGKSLQGEMDVLTCVEEPERACAFVDEQGAVQTHPRQAD